MSIGYACLTLGVPYSDFKSCLIRNAHEERLLHLIEHNLNSLENIIEYNIRNGIMLFRITSDLIPFGSNQVNKLPWQDIFAQRFEEIGQKIMKNGMRVSMHPGQYTVLNSPREEVVQRAVEDLNYHNLVLDSLGVGPEHKIILHIGGVFKEKEESTKRFIKNYKKLDRAVKNRLVIENDEKSFNICDVLEIGNILEIPVIFDNLHYKVNPGDRKERENYWIKECGKTWCKKDGRQKIHYSQQDPGKKTGSHSRSIDIDGFLKFYESIASEELDIMLEVKDKNISALKCINCTSKDVQIKVLRDEWERYKYLVKERSLRDYLEIDQLFVRDDVFSSLHFYHLVGKALKKEVVSSQAIDTFQDIWGYLENIAAIKEKKDFLRHIEKYRQGKEPLITVKNFLWRKVFHHKLISLMDSYYFAIN